MSIIPLSLSSLPSDMSVAELLSSVTAATATATALFLICKSRLMRLRPHEKNLVTLQSDAYGKMLFFSQIGTSKALAKRLCDWLEKDRVHLELVDARNYEPEALPKENLVVLVASTSEVWNQPSTRGPFSPDSIPFGAEFFANWIYDYHPAFRFGSFVVNACSFSAFVVGARVTENGKNLMAKAANQIRDLGHTAELNADFDSWWGSVVAVLQGVVLEVPDEPEPESESESEDVGSSDLKHLYMLVENVSYDVEDTKSHISFSFTIKHRMLSIDDNDNHTINLKERGHVTPDWPLRENLLINSPLPSYQGFCSLGSSFYFAGGMAAITDTDIIEAFDDTTKLWCLKVANSTCTWALADSTCTWGWSICGNLFCSRIRPLIVPYQGKLYIFGGENVAASWVDIYTISSRLWERREVPSSAILSSYMDPRCYLLWEDSTKLQKRTLIVLYFCRDNRQWLMSYDVKANSWEEVYCNFPPVTEYYSRQLLRLGCNHLLILDFPKVWYIYDLAKKELLANVAVKDLDDSEIISDIFCCHHTNEESLIYVFMEPDQKVVDPEESPHPNRVSYARVKLQHEDQTFSAKVESKSYLKVGPYIHRYIFAVGDEVRFRYWR